MLKLLGKESKNFGKEDIFNFIYKLSKFIQIAFNPNVIFEINLNN